MSVRIESNVKDKSLLFQRRSQIVSAAVELFTEKGFHKTTTREIAKASGMSIGALYEYVKSKEDILYLVCQHIHNEVARQLSARVHCNALGAQKLKSAITGLFQVIHTMNNEVLLIYQESKSLPKQHLQAVLAQEQEITDGFADLIREGMNDGSLRVKEQAVCLLAHDIVIVGQMLAFRRWGLKTVSFSNFVELQTLMLLGACGVHEGIVREDVQ